MKPVLIALGLLTLTALLRAETYDVIIRHGRVVDGSGNPAFHADVAVQAGRIVALGRVKGDARTEIDASGLLVTPGFIDVHTHADNIAQHPRGENFLRMGVTTVVVGNCGGSTLDVAGFFQEIQDKGISVNAATLIGHNTVREEAMGGSFDRPPTAEELATMKKLVDQAMRHGAVGLSTGLIYLPGVFSQTDEIVELARAVSPYDGIYATHMRYENYQIFDALAEVTRIAREAKVRAEVSHLKLAGERAWGQADRVLEFLENARAEGLDVTWDQYAYTASSTTLRQLIPDEAFDGGPETFPALLKDPARKARLVQRMKENLKNRGRDDYGYAVIASYRHDPSYNGLTMVEAAQKMRGGATLEDQIETILEIQRNGSGSGVFHGMSEADLQKFMQHPFTMVACDSGVRVLGKDVPHPRGYGNNARVLGRYVRELKVLRMEDAIRKMTSLPANTFRFTNRGQVREGYWADLVVLDPERVSDPATYNDPHHYAVGMPYVLVNGVPVIKNSEHTGAKPGKGLRHYL